MSLPANRLLSALRPRPSTLRPAFYCNRIQPCARRPLTPCTSGLLGTSARAFSLFSRQHEKQNIVGEQKPIAPAPTTPTGKLAAKIPKLALREKVFNVPNILTFSRLFASPVIGYLILNDYHTAALSLFAYAAATDLVDGWIARKWNLQTVVGSVIDPMADKTMMTILTVCLAAHGTMPVWLAVIILGRDVGLAISALWWRWISLPPPKTMARYWDFGLPSAEVKPTNISKLNTALQMGLLAACIADPVIMGGVEWQTNLEALKYTVGMTTVWSGLSYVYTKDAVKIIKHPSPEVEETEAKDDKMKQ